MTFCRSWTRRTRLAAALDRRYGRAVDALGFNGFHLDTYGYPRAALDATGRLVSIEKGYEVSSTRCARRDHATSSASTRSTACRAVSRRPQRPGFRYVEVWPPNDRWRHLEGLLARSAGAAEPQGDTLAIYPPVWDGERAGAAHRVLTEAIATTLGAAR